MAVGLVNEVEESFFLVLGLCLLTGTALIDLAGINNRFSEVGLFFAGHGIGIALAIGAALVGALVGLPVGLLVYSLYKLFKVFSSKSSN